MKVTVLYFANIREQTLNCEDLFEVNSECNLSELLSIVQEKYPVLSQLLDEIRRGVSDTAIAVNQELVKNYSISLKNHDEVAFIPPISGG
jgi:molybdopterin converting factor subunit 1